MATQADLVVTLDKFFEVRAFDEKQEWAPFLVGYESILGRFAAPGFLEGPWNGVMLDNTPDVDRVYLIVFPGESVLDTVIAREVERGAPGAIIFSHHPLDYQASGPGFVPIKEAQLEELRAHHISFYQCHAPLDCHAEISTSKALAVGLKLRDQERFASYHGSFAGVWGKIGPLSFQDLAKRVAEMVGVPTLRYDGIRHNGRPVQQIGIVAGGGGTPEDIQEALSLGCDTFVTGEWWLSGPGDYRTQWRESMAAFLHTADVNLIAASHYATEAVVMRTQMLQWFQQNTPGVEPVFIPQDDPWR